MADAAKVGLAMGLIFAFTFFALARIFASDVTRQGRRVADRLDAALELENDLAAYHASGRFPLGAPVLPPAAPAPLVRRRRRARIVPMNAADWKALTPEQRAERVLGVLPVHADDDNGLTGKSVAHQLGLGSSQQVTAPLTRLRKDGRATSRWDKARGNRVYWRATA